LIFTLEYKSIYKINPFFVANFKKKYKFAILKEQLIF
jgi:hypothetical protein